MNHGPADSVLRNRYGEIIAAPEKLFIISNREPYFTPRLALWPPIPEEGLMRLSYITWYPGGDCLHCDERLLSTGARQNFCSDRCRKDRRRETSARWAREHPRAKPSTPRTCIQCGTPFTAKRRDAVLCSAACRKRAQRAAGDAQSR